MRYYGYAGKILFVDLTRGKTGTEPLDMEMARQFIGGCGIGAQLFSRLTKPGIESLSPDNPIVISAGPLVGTLVPGSAKVQMLTKSATPANKDQTKYHIGWASGGSRRFGAMLKRTGYDQVVITGRASKPVYLNINDDEVDIAPADDLWGKKDAYETSEELTRRHKDSGVIAIGRAGENLIPFALAWVDSKWHIGKDGGASVMGSKNLKAIVVHGTKGVNVWDPERIKALAQAATKQIMQTDRFRTFRASRRTYSYPPEAFGSTLTGWSGCSSCIWACKDSHLIRGGEFDGDTLENGFEFALRCGEGLELKDYRHAMKLLDVCNRVGLSYAATLGIVKFIIRLYQRGIITRKETDGLELKPGNITTYIKLVERIARRDGIGDILARGWLAVSERFGVDPNVDPDGGVLEKGCTIRIDARASSLNPATFSQIVNFRASLELHTITTIPNLPLETIKGWYLGKAMSQEEVGRAFTSNEFNTGRLTKHTEDGQCVQWALGVCVMWVLPEQVHNMRMLAELYSTVTGMETTPAELKRAGERIWNIGKLLNIREGFTRADDVLPGLWANAIDEPGNALPGKSPLRDYFGRAVTHASFEKMLDDYYDEHGWDISTDLPGKTKLDDLGLRDL